MSLKYRGVDYEPATSHVAIPEKIMGRYRGAVVAIQPSKPVKIQHPQGLTYRGVVVH
jgi:hypothetical protein